MAKTFAGGVARPMKVWVVAFCVLLGGCQFFGMIANGAHRLYNIVADDRSSTDGWSDVQINMGVRDALAERQAALIVDVEVTVFEGAVLLTGVVPKTEVLNDILTATWSVPGVRKVYNYVRVGPAPVMADTAAEAALASRIKTQLGLTAGIESANYKLILENGTVYLMGVCAGDEEYARVQSILKHTDGVDKIVYLMRRPIED